MRTYNIPMSDADIDLIVQSLRARVEQLVTSIELERGKMWLKETQENNQCQQKNETFRSEPSETFRPAIIGAISGTAKPTAVYAPYGFKKDGTASKRRGRPAFKTKKVTT